MTPIPRIRSSPTVPLDTGSPSPSTIAMSVKAKPPAVSDMVRWIGNPSGESVIAMSKGPLRSMGAQLRSRLPNVGCSRNRWVNAGHPTIPVARSCSTRSSAAPASRRGITRSVTGSCRAPVAASTPPIQKNGIAHRIRLGAAEPARARDGARPRRRLPNERAVGVHDALRVGGRSRGVHHDGEVGGTDLGLDGGQNLVRHHVGGPVVPTRRPPAIRIAGQDDATQVRRGAHGEPAWRTDRPAREAPPRSAPRRRSRARDRERLAARRRPAGSPWRSPRPCTSCSAARRPRRFCETASHQTTQSTPLGKNRPTRQPLPTPWCSSHRAACALRRSASR